MVIIWFCCGSPGARALAAWMMEFVPSPESRSDSNPPTRSSRWPCSASAATAPPYPTGNDLAAPGRGPNGVGDGGRCAGCSSDREPTHRRRAVRLPHGRLQQHPGRRQHCCLADRSSIHRHLHGRRGRHPFLKQPHLRLPLRNLRPEPRAETSDTTMSATVAPAASLTPALTEPRSSTNTSRGRTPVARLRIRPSSLESSSTVPSIPWFDIAASRDRPSAVYPTFPRQEWLCSTKVPPLRPATW